MLLVVFWPFVLVCLFFVVVLLIDSNWFRFCLCNFNGACLEIKYYLPFVLNMICLPFCVFRCVCVCVGHRDTHTFV